MARPPANQPSDSENVLNTPQQDDDATLPIADLIHLSFLGEHMSASVRRRVFPRANNDNDNENNARFSFPQG